MDDYEPWLTPCDPDFDPEKCESAYALWAVKEEGEPVKFLEASITDNLDYPSGYWFFWRTISFSEEETVAEWRAHIAEGVVEKPVTPTDLARSASAAAATSAVIAASANQTAPKL